MPATVPTTIYRGSNDGRGPEIPPEAGSTGHRLVRLKGLFVPAVGSAQLHTAVVATVLLLDAILILFVPPKSSGVLLTGPAVYLILPAAASLYMGLVAISTSVPSPATGVRVGAILLPALSLAWAASLVGLIAFSGGPFAPVTRISASPWLYPACLSGISLPLAILWFGRAFELRQRLIGLSSAVIPPLIALASHPPGLGTGPTLAVVSATLFASAMLFQVSGTYLGRSAPSIPSLPPAVPRPVERPAGSPTRPSLWGRSQAGLRPTTGAGRPTPQDAVSLDATVPRTPARSTGRWPDVVSTGFDWLDGLFLGGLPRRGQVALMSEAGLGSEKVVWGTLAEALRRGESVVIATASSSVREIAEQMEKLAPGFTGYDRDGKVLWVDASGRGSSARSDPPGILGPGDYVRILSSLLSAAKEAERRSPRGFCLGFLGLSAMLDALDDPVGLAVLRNTVGILREHAALVTYSIEIRDQPRPAVKAILAELDGALLFRSANGRPLVKVFRLGPVETRDWVECRFDELRPRPPLRDQGVGVRTSPDLRASVP